MKEEFSEKMLVLKNIKKDYVTSSETVHALRGVDISFRDKEFVSILGPSGCGKTTLLNIIGGLDKYTSGDLIIGGRSTKQFRDRDWDVYRNHRVGFIFQSYNLIPHQTILGNVELALTIAGMSKAERVAKAKAALDKVGLGGQYNKRPNQLSGGQCQRVAIARALVNDPEILLADEPTGALDTVTSVQIMDLIKEIAEERLVVMVTHNPELAEQYSTRIIRFLDGVVVEDTNPVGEEEAEVLRRAETEAQESDKAATAVKGEGKKKKEKAKMSIFTAFRLSARNLISKKGRTAMVGFAGSIGIIGIALVLAFSAGIKGYVASMQDDLLSGNPITIGETTYDIEALTGMMRTEDKVEIVKQPNHIYINSLIDYIAQMSKDVDSMIIKNDITADYVNYVTSMPEEYYSAMLLEYGIDMSNNIYTEFYTENGGTPVNMSISSITNIYTAILGHTDFSEYASYITTIVPSFEQAPDNPEYIRHQYDVIGEIADERDEVMLVLDSDEMLSDVLLARLGFYTQEEFLNIVYKATGTELGEDDPYRESFTHDELLGKTFTWYPNDAIFSIKEIELPTGTTMTSFGYANTTDKFTEGNEAIKDGIELRISGILYTNDTTTYGCLTSGIYYTEALTEYVLEKNGDSEMVKYVNEHGDITSMSYNGMPIGVYYNFDYQYEGESYTSTAFVGATYGLDDLMSMAGSAGSSGSTGGGMGGMGGMNTADLSSIKTLSARDLGGVKTANKISIFPISFDSKNLVTDYLDLWNAHGSVTVGDKTIAEDDRTDVTYTDTLELVINLINNMIDVVSYALIAFTSISLVVSTVMIGIITYVSVVERIKEIGVIRSLGGRKKDVSRLFTAETFIIGLLSGLFGIGVTYIISAIASAIVFNLISIKNIAALPADNALILILLSVVLTLISGLLPAKSAARKDPVVALRTE